MGPKNAGVATAWSGVAMATLDPPQMAPLILATEISDQAPTFLNLPCTNVETNKIKILF